MSKNIFSILLLVIGILCGLYGIILVMGHIGTYKPWRPPFSHYEIKTFIVFIISAITIIAGIKLRPITSSSRSGGQREVFFESASPDGRYIASFYREHDGYAGGRQYEYVAIRSKGGGDSSIVLTLRRGYDISLKWVDEKQIEVGYPDYARVDHWQSWFGRNSEGIVELTKFASKEGRFAETQAGCSL